MINLDDVTNSEIQNWIDEYIHSKRDRAILKDRLIDGMTHEQLAEKHQLSVRRVKTIIYKAEDRLFKHLRV